MEKIASDEWMCLDAIDISGCSSNFGFERMFELEEVLTFPGPEVTDPATPLYKRRVAGVESARNSIAGYLDAAVTYAAFSAAINASPVVTYGTGRALGSPVFMYVGKEGAFNYGGALGKVIPISGEIASDGLVMPGSLFEFGTKSATGNGTSRTVAAVTAGKKRVIHVHVLDVTGTGSPSMTVIYETSALGTFVDAITKWTSSPFTAKGRQRAVLTSAVSDTKGRFRWTITGTTPGFVVRMSEGVR
jgi:hypothetical protein